MVTKKIMANRLRVIIAAIVVFGLATLAMAQTIVATTTDPGTNAASVCNDGNNGWNSLAVDAAGNIYTVGTAFLTGSVTASRIIIAAYTPAGVLNTAFNTTGVVIMGSLSGAGHLDQGNGIALDSSDNVYIVGTADADDSNALHATRADIVVAKFTAGALAAWGTTGTGQGGVTGSGVISFDSGDISGNANGDDYGYGIALTLPSSPTTTKVVVVGQSNGPDNNGGTAGAKSDMVVFQLTNAGALDTTAFSTGGIGVPAGNNGKAGALLVNAKKLAAGAETTTDIGTDVVIDGSGNIYALDSSTSNTATGLGINVFKITSAGAVDTSNTFGNFQWNGIAPATQGVAQFDPGTNGPPVGFRMTLDASGHIYVVGTGTAGVNNIGVGGSTLELLLVRFTSAGVLDTANFNSTGGIPGAVTINAAEGTGVSVQTGGNVFVSGNSYGTKTNFLIAEYNSTGGIVTGFGSSGQSIYSTPAGFDQGSKDPTLTQTATILTNGRTGIYAAGASGTAVVAVGGENTNTITQQDGLLLSYTLTAATGASTAAATTASTSSSSSGCGALGLDAVVLLGVAYLLKRKLVSC